MTTFFCNVVHAEPPYNTAQASILVSTSHATVETTSSPDDSLARKPHSCLMHLSMRCIVWTLLSGSFAVRLKQRKCCNMVTYTICVEVEGIGASKGGQIERTGDTWDIRNSCVALNISAFLSDISLSLVGHHRMAIHDSVCVERKRTINN